ncbi:Kinesin-4, partial [Tetrabaena socialis]
QVLQDSLCGSSKVLLVANISPEHTSGSESLSSLNFASRAAQVELGAARRSAPSERPAPSPSPHDRSPAPDRTAEGGRATPPLPAPCVPPLPIMNGTAAKVRAQAAAGGGGGGARASQHWGGGGGGGGGSGSRG